MQNNTSNKRRSPRDKIEIWSEILEACSYEEKTQSWLIREIRLKTSSIKDAVEFLIRRDLLECADNRNSNNITYKTTSLGKDALLKYYEIITNYFKK